MVVYYNGVDISKYKKNNYVGDPVLNQAKIRKENSSSSLIIVITLTQKQYDTLPEKNQHCFYLITDSIDFDYNHLENSPLINNIKIDENTTKEELDLITEEETKNVIAGVFQYKGEVEKMTDLPLLPVRGNVYFVREQNSSFAFNGETWNNLGVSVDLSKFQTKIDNDLTTDNKTIIEAINELFNIAQLFEGPTEDEPGTQGIVSGPDVSGKYLQNNNTWTDTIASTKLLSDNIPLINGYDDYTSESHYYAIPTSKPEVRSAWASAGNGEAIWREIQESGTLAITNKIMLEYYVGSAMPKINNTRSYNSNSNFYAPTSIGKNNQILTTNGDSSSPIMEWKNIDDVIPVVTPATSTKDGVTGLFPSTPANSQNKLYTSYGNVQNINDSSSAAKLSSTGTNVCTVRDIYYALPSLNNKTYQSSINFYGVPTTKGTSGQVCVSNGSKTNSWDWKNFTSLDAMVGCTSSTNGANGLVPAPSAGTNASYLTNKATWEKPTLSSFSTTATGFVPSVSSANNYAVLASDCTWKTWPSFSTFSSSAGIVPAPSAGQQNYYLGPYGWVSDVSTEQSAMRCNVTFDSVHSNLALKTAYFIHFGSSCGYFNAVFYVNTAFTVSDSGSMVAAYGMKVPSLYYSYVSMWNGLRAVSRTTTSSDSGHGALAYVGSDNNLVWRTHYSDIICKAGEYWVVSGFAHIK